MINTMTPGITFYCNEKYKGLVPEPIPASNCFPKWYSQLTLKNSKCPYVVDKDNIYELKKFGTNIKKCFGIQDFLNTGYIIPAWSDFIFREQDDGGMYVNWMNNFYENNYMVHEDDQFYTMPNKPIYGHFDKFGTPWIIKTDPGISCLVTHPIWHRNKSFTSSTGVLHTDKTAIHMQWFFEWNYKIPNGMSMDNIDVEKQIIKKEEPIILIIPFYRKKFSSKIKYLAEEKFDTIKYQHHYNTIEGIGECPYKKFRKNLGRFFYIN